MQQSLFDKPLNTEILEERAFRTRQHILRMSTNGGCFTGASLSCTDILCYLYTSFLNITPDTCFDIDRDYFFLSKGHDVPALYGVLAECGFFDVQRLEHHLTVIDSLYWHPNTSIPGIEFHSGSLGHVLSVAMGVAYDCKKKQRQNRIVVLAGDGELNEGSMWEAMLVAHALQLHNLILIIDRNQFQANMRTEELIPLEPLAEKFKAFGWHCTEIDGHDFNAMHSCIPQLRTSSSPSVVIASTKRGKGVPSIEERADRWFCNFTHDEVDALLNELALSEPTAELVSVPLTVR